MARVVLHSAICSGKASQHSDSSLTRNPDDVDIFWPLTQFCHCTVVPFQIEFLWVARFMVSPEARVQFSDSQRFKELSSILPIVHRKQGRSTFGRSRITRSKTKYDEVHT